MTDPSFPPFPPDPDLPVSTDFQDAVLQRVHKHHRTQRLIRTGFSGGLAALCAFFVGQQIAFRRMGSQPVLTPRVLSAQQGVQWLLDTQNPDGSWSVSANGGNEQFVSGVTSLATLALLKSPDPVPREHIQKACAVLEKELSGTESLRNQGPEFYNRMLSLYTLQEVNRHLPDPQRERLLRHHVSLLIRSQHPEGGWGYLSSSPFGYRDTAPPNSAVTWWTLNILKRAGSLPGKQHAVAKASAWLQKRFENPGTPEYRADDPGAADPNNALVWMARAFHPGPDSPGNAPGIPDAYRDYLRSQVEQPEELLSKLRDHQESNGSWHLPADRWWKAGGQVYVTALRVLAQVPRES